MVTGGYRWLPLVTVGYRWLFNPLPAPRRVSHRTSPYTRVCRFYSQFGRPSGSPSWAREYSTYNITNMVCHRILLYLAVSHRISRYPTVPHRIPPYLTVSHCISPYLTVSHCISLYLGAGRAMRCRMIGEISHGCGQQSISHGCGHQISHGSNHVRFECRCWAAFPPRNWLIPCYPPAARKLE